MSARKCFICNCSFRGRSDAKTCSPRCRKRLQLIRDELTERPAMAGRRHALKKSALLLLLGLSSLLGLVFSSSPPQARALTPASTLNFQARLLNAAGAVVPDGDYNIDFKIYSADSTTGTVGSCSGACLWEETRTGGNQVAVTNGYFSVNLGSVTGFPAMNWDQQLYLTMNIGGTGAPSWDGEMQNAGHSIALTSVPLAFRANQLAVAGTNEQILQFANNTFGQATTISLPDPGASTATVCYQNASACGFAAASGSSNYVQFAPAVVQADGSSNNSIFINKTAGTGNIMNLQKSGSDVFAVDNSGNVVIGAGDSFRITGGNTASRPGSPTEGMLYYDTTTKSLLVYANGKWQADRSSSSKLVGMGTATGCTGSSPVASLNVDAADYVVTSCTSAQTTINTAITALGSTGGTVYLMEGTYIIDGTINLASNVTLAGAGAGTILKLKDSINAGIDLFTLSSINRVTVKDLRLDGNRTNNTSGTQNAFNISSVGSGTGTSAVPGLSASDITVQNFRSDAFSISSITNSVISNSNLINNGSRGIEFKFSGGTNDSYLRINGNTIQGSGDRGIWGDITGNPSYVTIDDNIIESNTGAGVYLSGNSNAISGNVFRSNGNKGIQLFGSNNTVSSNNFVSNTGSGVYVRGGGNAISSNTMTSNTGNGVEIDSASSGQNAVTGNKINSNGSSGIYAGGSNNSITGNDVMSNTGHGIEVVSSSNNVTGNAVASNTSDGIHIGCCSNVNNIVSGNQVSSNSGSGITVDASDTTRINDNWIYNNGGSGSTSSILIFANAFHTPDKNIITNNTIVDTAGTGYAIELSGGLKPTNTYISGNSYSGTGATSFLTTGTTGTTYINQSQTATSDYLYRFGTDSATAFQVQSAGGSESLLSIDTTARSASGGNLIKIGNSTGSDTATTILVLDSAASALTSNLGALNGGLFYNSGTGHINVIEGGVVKELCNKTDLGCGTGSTPTLAQVYSYGAGTSDSTIALDSTRGGIVIKDSSTPITGSLFSIQNNSGGKFLDVSSSAITVGENTVGNATATATTATTSGTGTNTTTVTLTAVNSLANGDVIFIDNAGQDYFTRITAGGGTTSLTVDPAVTYENARTVTKYSVQYLGSDGTNFSGSTRNQNSFYQGYFLGGVVTGAGSTVYSDANISSVGNLQINTASGVNVKGTNSTTAFQIQNAAGTNILNVDSTNLKVSLNQSNLYITDLSAPTAPGVAAGANTGGNLLGAAGTTYYYKITALSGTGESLGSSEVSINGQGFTKLSTPGAATVGAPSAGGSVTLGTHSYKVTFVTANGETTGGTTSTQVNVTTGGTQTVPLTAIPLGATGTTQRKIYRTVAGDTGNYLLVTTIANNTTTTFNDTVADASLGAAAPASNTATTSTNNATVTWTAVAGATGYRVYRGTAAGAESAYQTAASSPFTDTGAAGTAGTVPTRSTVAQIGIGTSTPSANLDVRGTAQFVDNAGSGGTLGIIGSNFTALGTNGFNFKPTTDSTSAFQVQSSAGVNVLSAGYGSVSTQYINDNLTSNSPTGTLYDSASWVSGQYVQLNPASSGTDGELEYTPAIGTNDFTANFEFFAGGGSGADSTFFYTNSTSRPTGEGAATGGYQVYFSEYLNRIALNYNGSDLATNGPGNIGNSTWHTVQVVKTGTNFKVYYDSSLVINYTDSARTLTGTKWGFGARSGGSTNNHRVRNFNLTGTSIASNVFNVNGSATFKTDLNNSNSFQIQNSSGIDILNSDSSNMQIAVQSSLALIDLPAPTSPGVAAGATTGGTLSGAAATTYYYRITAMSGSGESLSSSEVSINGQSFTKLTAPTAPTAALGAAGNVTGTYTYKVTFVTANGETTAGTASASVSPSAQQVNLTAIPLGATGTTGRNVYRCDSAGNNCLRMSAGTTIANNTTTTLTDNTASYTGNPAPPGANTATTSTNTATVTWTAVAGATGYRVYRGTAAGAESAYQTAASSPFTDTGAAGTAGTVPTRSTVAQIGIGTSTPSANLDVRGTAQFVDNAGSGGTLGIIGSNFTALGTNGFNFKPTTDSTTAFQIQNAAGQQAINISTTTNSLSVTQGNLSVSGLTNITSVPTLISSGSGGTLAAGTYYYQVAAVNANGTTPAIATNPTSVTTSGSTSQNTITWVSKTNASGYKVYRSTNGTTWFVNSVGSTSTTLVDNGSTYSWSTASSPPTTNTTGGNLSVKGAATFINASNSTSALDVQDATGDSILKVDSTDRRIGVNNSAPIAALDVVAAPPAPSFTWGFEDGTYGPFSHSGNYNVSTANPHSGSYAWGNNCDLDNDTITLTRSIASAGTISFYAYLHGFWGGWNVFWIDGVAKISEPSGTVPYTFYSFPLSAGSHTFQWNSGDSCDGIYIDDVTIGESSPTNTAAIFNGGNVGIGTLAPSTTLEVDGTSLFKAASGSDSTSLFQIQNAAGTNILNVDSSNLKVSLNQSNFYLTDLPAPTSPGVAAGATTGGTLSGAAATTYYYRITAMSGSGESLSSSEVSINGQSFTKLTAPTAPTAALGAAGNVTGTYTYKVTFVTANGETTAGTASASVSPSAQQVNLTAIPLGATGTTGRNVYRCDSAGNNCLRMSAGTTIANNTTTTLTDNTASYTGNPAPPGANTATTSTNTATVSWSAVTGATSYRIYRGTTSGAESAYQTAASSPFTDTGAAGTAGTVHTYSTVDQIGIGTSTPAANLDVEGTALFKNGQDSTSAFQVQNAAGSSVITVDTTNKALKVAGGATYSTISYSVGSGFASHVDYTVGSGPALPGIADFNGDGKKDLAVPNGGSGTISILLGNGNGTFGAKNDISVGGAPKQVITADFNGDGNQDLGVANDTGCCNAYFQVLLGNGDGTFAAATSYSVNSDDAIQAGDFNGDGKPDIAVANHANDNILVYLNSGTGTFTFNNSYATGSRPLHLAIADFNGDTKLDIVSANNLSNSVSFFAGNGDGTFVAKVDTGTASNSYDIASGDFNGDGKIDIALESNINNNVSVQLGNGDGTFGSVATYTTGGNAPQAIISADFTGDGKPDLAVTDQNANAVLVYNNTGTGTFSAFTSYTVGTGPYGLGAGDFNGDTTQDIAASNNGTTTESILLNGATPTTTVHNGTISVAASSATTTGLIIQAAASQTDDLMRIQDSSGSAYLEVTSAGLLKVNTLDSISGNLTIGASSTAIILGNNTRVAAHNSFSALGASLFQDATNSATAFQVQNSSGTSILAVDTLNGNINLGGPLWAFGGVNVSGNTTTFTKITLDNAHFKSTQTTAPTIGTPTNCATSPTSAVGTGSTDSAGSFRITSGTGGGQTTCDTVITFNKAYGAAPKSILVVAETKDGGTGTAAARQIYVSASGTTTFTVKMGSAPAGASEVNWFYYWVIE